MGHLCWPRMKKGKAFLIYWLPPLLWAGLIFGLSSFTPTVPPVVDWPGLDKGVHMILFGVLAILLQRAFNLRTPLTAFAAASFSMIIVMLYGALDEWHQSFVPGRRPDSWDWVADSVGAIVGVLSFQGLFTQLKQRMQRDGTYHD